MHNINKIISIFFLLFISAHSIAQNKSKLDLRIKQNVLYGVITLDAFEMNLCKDWYAPQYKSYQAKKNIRKQLASQNFESISISLIFGSWCHDSHREVPRIIKILKEISFPFSQLQINALDSSKKSPSYDAKAENVKFVPTLIIYRNKTEIGRIVEKPKKTLEKDLLTIISKN